MFFNYEWFYFKKLYQTYQICILLAWSKGSISIVVVMYLVMWEALRVWHGLWDLKKPVLMEKTPM